MSEYRLGADTEAQALGISSGYGTRIVGFQDRFTQRPQSNRKIGFAAPHPDPYHDTLLGFPAGYDVVIAAPFPGGESDPHPSLWDHEQTWENKRCIEHESLPGLCDNSNLIFGAWARPGEQVNPYYLDPVTTHDDQICFVEPEDGDALCSYPGAPGCDNCRVSCEDVKGGCTFYNTISTFGDQQRTIWEGNLDAIIREQVVPPRQLEIRDDVIHQCVLACYAVSRPLSCRIEGYGEYSGDVPVGCDPQGIEAETDQRVADWLVAEGEQIIATEIDEQRAGIPALNQDRDVWQRLRHSLNTVMERTSGSETESAAFYYERLGPREIDIPSIECFGRMTCP